MGKNHRHTKKLKSEKSKIKLKTQKTKFLPKGQNVTDTNFKIKPIVVPEQLVQHKTHTTSQNLDFKDIINRINHHNVSVKTNGLQQLKEYINTVDHAELNKYVLHIFEHLCTLYGHFEQKLRRDAIKLTYHLIQIIKSDGVEPYLNRIVSYLCCTMTHLNENIQEDSLLLFDALFNSVPDLLAMRCDKIVKNFILLISKIKVNANDKSMLQNTIKNKKTSIEWRLMVLTRLKNFFGVILEKKQEKDVKLDPPKVVIVQSYSVYTPIYYKRKEIDIYGENINIDVWLDDCVKDVLDLLKGIWLEVQPTNKHSIKSAELYCTVINNETLNILNCIVNMISYFYGLMVIKSQENQEDSIGNLSFIKNSKEIVTLIFETFPFSKQNNKNAIDSKCFEENLTLCYLFFAFFDNDYNKNLVIQSLSYLNVCLVNRNYIPKEKSQFLLKTLKQFYECNVKSWKKHKKFDLSLFIRNTAKYYINCNPQQKNSTEIFQFLCEHIDLIEEDFFEVVQKACRSLIGPRIDLKTYKAIRLLLLRNVNEVQIVVSILLPQILDNIGTLEFEGIEHICTKEIKILSLFKNISLNDKHISCLKEFGKKSEKNHKLVENMFLIN